MGQGKGSQLGAEMVLLSVAFVWGLTFTLVKDALEHVQVFVFLSQRFVLAFICFVPFMILARKSFSWRALWQGSVLGFFLFGAYAFQTIGLKFTTASNTAFVTGMNVLLVPVFNSFFFKQTIPKNVWAGVFFAGFGLAGLCLGRDFSLNPGDLIVILCAACIALQIIYTGRYVKHSDVYWLAAIQVGMVGLLSSLVVLGREDPVLVWIPEIFWALIICAVFASTYAFWAQTAMQRFTIPSKTALIFCMEPVFGAIYARFAGGEYLGLLALLGGGLIVLGMLLAEVPDLFFLLCRKKSS